MNKTKTIQVKVKEVEPKLFTMIFEYNNKYHKFQEVAYCLEDAVKKCTIIVDPMRMHTPKMNELWWWFSVTISEIQTKFKNVR